MKVRNYFTLLLISILIYPFLSGCSVGGAITAARATKAGIELSRTIKAGKAGDNLVVDINSLNGNPAEISWLSSDQVFSETELNASFVQKYNAYWIQEAEPSLERRLPENGSLVFHYNKEIVEVKFSLEGLESCDSQGLCVIAFNVDS